MAREKEAADKIREVRDRGRTRSGIKKFMALSWYHYEEDDEEADEER